MLMCGSVQFMGEIHQRSRTKVFGLSIYRATAGELSPAAADGLIGVMLTYCAWRSAAEFAGKLHVPAMKLEKCP
jgi:hypothetical protein